MSIPFMPMYWGDYLKDTADLTTLQHGSYLLLIAHYWNHGGLPMDERRLQRITKCPNNHWKQTWEALQPYFSVERNKFGSLERKHKRIDAELAKANELFTKRVISGTKGGFSSRGKTNQQRNLEKVFSRQINHQTKQTGEHPHSHSSRSVLPFSTAARRTSEEEEG